MPSQPTQHRPDPDVEANRDGGRPLRAIEVSGARTHNLRAVDCRIPHGRLTVVTGVSGAGKSSLAFDTIYAEAHRRFMESLSTYARQFLEQMERPPVDRLEGVLPAIALEARNPVRNARSTVGTITEVHDVLRSLFAQSGVVTCASCGEGVVGRGPQELADLLIAEGGEERLLLIAEVARPRKHANVQLAELVRQGYFRRLSDDGEVERMTPSARWPKALDPLPLVLGSFRGREDQRARLLDAIEEGYRLTAGRLVVRVGVERWHFGRSPTCRSCGLGYERPTPALFSFHSPLGACPTCQGFGRVQGIDRCRVVPDPSRSLEDGAIAPWNSDKRAGLRRKMLLACREAGIRTDVPWQDLADEERELVWSGPGFTNLERFFARLERKSYRMHVRILLSRYRSYDTCPDCQGRRLVPEALAVRIAGRHLADLLALSVEDLLGWLRGLSPDEVGGGAEPILGELTQRLEVLHRVGLDYLALDRQARTLSGGESQRIQLATALASGLTGTLYVLDEPTIGLHPSDSAKLLSLLRDLAGRGNTVLVVEHDRTLIEGADHVVDMGPGAGENGGLVLAEGRLEEILSGDSATARCLAAPLLLPQPSPLASLAEDGAPRVTIVGARENNLQNLDVSFPLGCLVAVTGVSGSGKSTLIEKVLHGTYQRSRGVVDVDPGACDGLEGLDDLDDVLLVDQRPLGRSSRSNPATYTKAYDEIRKIYAASPGARERGIGAGHFSFNLKKGRCDRCEGTGVEVVDLHFMEPVRVVCEDCGGRRFRRQVLEVTVDGRNIDATLNLTIEQAVAVFARHKPLCRRLQSLLDVGLGYLRLGQETTTLSGGEAQRLKLARFLDRRASAKPRLYLFDEPTTGLHLADIDRLYGTLRRLVDRGDSVLVVEHSPELVARADWIVDLGPGGGDHGGRLQFSGPLAQFLCQGEGATAEVLRDVLAGS